MAKITKVILHQKTDTGEYINLFPRTTGDQVSGTVKQSSSIGDLASDKVMPKYHDEKLEIKTTDDKRQGIIVSQLIVEKDADNVLANQVSDGQIYATGKIFANNGQEVVTKNTMQDYLTSIQNSIYTMVIEESECANRLKNVVQINGVDFNGTKSINIPIYTVASSAPSNTKLLWINSADGTINYYYNNAWHTCTGSWSDV